MNRDAKLHKKRRSDLRDTNMTARNLRRNCSSDKQKETVLRELRRLAADRISHRQTVLRRFFECQELQMSSALLARAVEQSTRWHAGKRLGPPGGPLPPHTGQRRQI